MSSEEICREVLKGLEPLYSVEDGRYVLWDPDKLTAEDFFLAANRVSCCLSVIRQEWEKELVQRLGGPLKTGDS